MYTYTFPTYVGLFLWVKEMSCKEKGNTHLHFILEAY